MNVARMWITAIKNEGVIIHPISFFFFFCHLHAFTAVVSELPGNISPQLLHCLFSNKHTEALQNEPLIRGGRERSIDQAANLNTNGVSDQ